MVEKIDQIKKLLRGKDFKKFGGVIGLGSDINYEKLDTPFFQVNKAIGGGFPRTKHTCISGHPGTGKTVLMLHTIAYHQAKNEDFIVTFLDVENALDPAWAERLGIDLERIIIITRLNKLEDYLDVFIKIAKSGCSDMIILDSIGAASPRGEIESKTGQERSVEDDTQGLQARKYAQFFRMVTPHVSKHNIASVFIAQVYTDINSYGGMTMVKGGNAFKHFTHLRLMTRRARDKTTKKVVMPDGNIKEIELGWDMHVRVDKSKQSPTEGHEVVLPFRNGAGIVGEEAAIITAINLGIIERNGAWFKWHDMKRQGKNSIINYFKEDKEKLQELSDELVKKVDEETIEDVFRGTVEEKNEVDAINPEEVI